jgi:hypothetical protein
MTGAACLWTCSKLLSIFLLGTRISAPID